MEKPIKIKKPIIKTLDEILADVGKPVSAKMFGANHKNDENNKHDDIDHINDTSIHHQAISNQPTFPTIKPKTHSHSDDVLPNLPKKQSPKKKAHLTHQNTKQSAVESLLNNDNQTVLDDDLLKLLSRVEIEKLAVPDKHTRYMRWLAFYYLSKKELSRVELKNKLLAKDCDPVAVDELLVEFAQKNYQSDERCVAMIVRESVRKGRGKRHIAQVLQKAGLDIKDFGGIDKLIVMSDASSVSDGTILDDGHDTQEIDWLKLAVEARCKKYGNTIPKDPKEKARQLRFLQYRGFTMTVCFDALKITLADFDKLA